MTPATHDHHDDHHPAPSADADRRWLAIALTIVAGFLGVEVVAGILATSLALLADAAYILTGAASLALALLTARPAGGSSTSRLDRAEVRSAQVDGAALLVLAGVIAWNAGQRLVDPPEVEGGVVVVVGLLGALANLGAAAALSRAERRSVDAEGATAHVLTGLYASVAAAVAGVLILLTGLNELDGVAALVVAALMVAWGWRLLRDAPHVALEDAL